MTDPLRLLDNPSELLDEERELLRAGRGMEPPDALSRALWSSLASKLSLAALPLEGAPKSAHPSAATAASGKAGVSLALVKGALIVGAFGVAALVGRAWLRSQHASPPPAPAVVASSAQPVSAATPSALAAQPAPEVNAASASSVKPVASVARQTTVAHPAKSSERTPAPVSSSDVREESRAVAAARDALRGGNASGALGLLEQARQRFGGGVLGQEREALTIEALAKSGQTAQARARGQAFLKTYANSPYAAKVRQIVGNPPE